MSSNLVSRSCPVTSYILKVPVCPPSRPAGEWPTDFIHKVRSARRPLYWNISIDKSLHSSFIHDPPLVKPPNVGVSERVRNCPRRRPTILSWPNTGGRGRGRVWVQYPRLLSWAPAAKTISHPPAALSVITSQTQTFTRQISRYFLAGWTQQQAITHVYWHFHIHNKSYTQSLP